MLKYDLLEALKINTELKKSNFNYVFQLRQNMKRS